MRRKQKENDTKKAEANKKLLQQNSSETPLKPFTSECHRKPQLGATNAFFFWPLSKQISAKKSFVTQTSLH